MRLALGIGALWALVGLLGAAGAEDRGVPAPLPEPLTLEQALALAEAQQPPLARARAAIDYERANVSAVEALNGVNLLLEGRARWVDPNDKAPDQSEDDHKAALLLRKNLYDFGRSAAREGAARILVDARQLHYLDSVERQRLQVMERFFDVLLADMETARDNEALATAYIAFDRLRNRQELGQVSDIALLETGAEYQVVRRRFAASQARQRLTRAQLAIALDRPGTLPASLETPELAPPLAHLPEYEVLLAKALADNPRLRGLRTQVAAARQRVDAARAGGRPVLTGEIEIAGYSRDLGSNDDRRAGLTLQMPLYTGGTVQAEVGREQAKAYELQADLEAAEREVREAVLSTWLELQTLKVEADQVAAQQAFRGLYLDRSRSLYEMEVKTDLGDAMVRLSEAQLAEARTRFATALAWARLAALTNGLPAADGGGS